MGEQRDARDLRKPAEPPHDDDDADRSAAAVPAPPPATGRAPAGAAPGGATRAGWRPTGVTWGQLVAATVAPPLLLVLLPVVAVGVLAIVGQPTSGREVIDVMAVAAGAALAGVVGVDAPFDDSLTVGAAPLLLYALLAMALCRWRTSRGVVSVWWPTLIAAAASAALWTALSGLLALVVSGDHGVDLTVRWLTSAGAGAGIIGLAHLRTRTAAGRRAVRWLLVVALLVTAALTGITLYVGLQQQGFGALQGPGLVGLGVAALGYLLLSVNVLVWLVFLPLGAPLGGTGLTQQIGFVELAADAPLLWVWPPALIVLAVAFGWGLPGRGGWAAFGRSVGLAAAVALAGFSAAELVGRYRLGMPVLPPELTRELGVSGAGGDAVSLGLGGAPGILVPGLVVLVALAAADSYLRSVRDHPGGWARLPGVRPGPAESRRGGFCVGQSASRSPRSAAS